MELEIVSELDEGKLAFRSVARAHPVQTGHAAVVDIGGGSVEVVQSDGGVITMNTSMPLGAVRLTEAFGGAVECAGDRFDDMRRHVTATLRKGVRRPQTPPAIVVGCGGTFTSLATVAAAQRGVIIGRNSPAIPTLGPISRTQLKDLIRQLRDVPLEQRLRVPGLPADRADIIIAGLLVVERLLRHLGAEHVHVHNGGVREGLILRMVEQRIAENARPVSARPETLDPASLLSAARRFAARPGTHGPTASTSRLWRCACTTSCSQRATSCPAWVRTPRSESCSKPRRCSTMSVASWSTGRTTSTAR